MTEYFVQISRDYLAGMDQEIQRLQGLREQVAALVGVNPTLVSPGAKLPRADHCSTLRLS